MLNTQAPEKAERLHERILDVHSVFYTLQGEGPLVGAPAVFVRLAGCNLQCPGCDTNYTTGRRWKSYAEILQAIRIAYVPIAAPQFSQPLIVISGGEPFRQDIGPFIAYLLELGYNVQIETNGTLGPGIDDLSAWKNWVDDGQVIIVCSPKAGKVHKTLLPLIGAYKYVISSELVDPEDGLPTFALRHPASPRVFRAPKRGTLIYIQPMDEQDELKNAENLKAALASSMRYGYRLCLQTHKILGLE